MTRNDDPLYSLPPDLPVPTDDGAADHLPGSVVPSVALRATSGASADPTAASAPPLASAPTIDLASACAQLTVVYVYPRTGGPGQELPEGWDEIPGARGCTVQNCVFRDHAAELRQRGAEVFGLSAQPFEEQVAFAARERIPYPLLNDSDLRLVDALGLPTFEAAGMRLYKRLTFVAREGRIERVVYPVFPPGGDVGVVLEWLR